jgi:uncharacterized protein (DUF983 family)
MSSISDPAHFHRPRLRALKRGFLGHCPRCGEAPIFAGYLRTRDHCEACGLEIHQHRADDAPPYFTIMIVGHIVIAGLVALEANFHPPTWVHMALWLPLTLAMTLALLRPVKGALIGYQWALGMHGFDSSRSDA